MATTIRLDAFTTKATPVGADIIYGGDSANAFDEIQMTASSVINIYPNLTSIGGLTLGANTYPYVNNSAVFTAGTITALGVALLADTTIAAMQLTLGYTSTVTATSFAGWDASKNLGANNFIAGYATTVTAAATTTLVVSSAEQQFFTGSTTQTVLLPVTSTLVLGQSFYIVNNSSGVVTVQSSGANTIQAMAANTTLLVTCVLTSGTTAASWNADYNVNTPLTLPLSIANGGTGVASVTVAPVASSWAGWDANNNLSANNFLPAYTTTATAAGTTTLTVASTYNQFFTGSTTQTVVMPVTSTLVLGQTYYIVNSSSGNLTIQSSGGNTILTMTQNTEAYLTCISTSGTSAASWYFSFLNKVESAGTVTSVSAGTGLTGGPITTTGSLAVSYPVSAGGNVTQSAFQAIGALQSNVTGDGTVYDTVWATVNSDRNSNFNGSTGVFTAPVTGIYVFNFSLRIQNIGAAHALYNILANFNGTQNDWLLIGNVFAQASSGAYVSSGSISFYMTATQTFKLQIQVSGSTKTINVNGVDSTFSGYLVA